MWHILWHFSVCQICVQEIEILHMSFLDVMSHQTQEHIFLVCALCYFLAEINFLPLLTKKGYDITDTLRYYTYDVAYYIDFCQHC